VYVQEGGYATDAQWVPTSSGTVTQNLRLVQRPSIAVGQATSVSIGPDSALCLDDAGRLQDHRCAELEIVADAPGRLTVEITPAAGGGGAPLLAWEGGDYSGAQSHPDDRTWSIPIRGGTYWILVGIPDGSPSGAFDVVTSIR